jgi:hypothetical protein
MQNTPIFKKYKPYPLVHLAHREWASNIITSAPIWVSTDLRDGNQALVEPMSLIIVSNVFIFNNVVQNYEKNSSKRIEI